VTTPLFARQFAQEIKKKYEHSGVQERIALKTLIALLRIMVNKPRLLLLFITKETIISF